MASKRAISVERYENMGEAALVQKIMTREALVSLLEDLARLDERSFVHRPRARYTLLLGLCQLRRVTVDVLNGILAGARACAATRSSATTGTTTS